MHVLLLFNNSFVDVDYLLRGFFVLLVHRGPLSVLIFHLLWFDLSLYWGFLDDFKSVEFGHNYALLTLKTGQIFVQLPQLIRNLTLCGRRRPLTPHTVIWLLVKRGLVSLPWWSLTLDAFLIEVILLSKPFLYATFSFFKYLCVLLYRLNVDETITFVVIRH